MKYIGNTPQYEEKNHLRFDYIESVNPTVSINPDFPNTTFLNSDTGEIFHCTDNTPNANVWAGPFTGEIS